MSDINPYEPPKTANDPLPKESGSGVLLRLTIYVMATIIGAFLGSQINAATRIIVAPGDPPGYAIGVFLGALAGLVIVLITINRGKRQRDGQSSQA